MYSGIIYLYRSRTSGKPYVGQTRQPKRRYNNHKKCSKDDNTHFGRAKRKYGFDDFEYSVIETLSDETLENLQNKLNVREKYWIKYYDSIKNGYNSMPGGTRLITTSPMKGRKFSAEHIRKISEANRGRKATQETIQKLRESHLGYKMPDSQREKISKSHKLRFKAKGVSQETRDKLSKSRKGFKMSDEQKQKLSQYKGEKASMFGRHHSDETKQKMRDAAIGRKLSDEQKRKLSLSHIGKSKGQIYVTNGIVNKRISPTDTIPDGFYRGYTKYKKQ